MSLNTLLSILQIESSKLTAIVEIMQTHHAGVIYFPCEKIQFYVSV